MILYAEHQIVERDCLRVILGMSAIDVPMQDAKEDKLTRGTMRSLEEGRAEKGMKDRCLASYSQNVT